MKNSLKIFIAAGVLLFGSLGAYTAGLRAEYARGTYKDPLRNYAPLAFRNFSTLDVPAAGVMNVKVESGPFAVYVHKEDSAYVRVSQQGGRLTVALNFPDDKAHLAWMKDAVLIRCPRLDAITAGTTYTVAGRAKTVRQSENDANGELLVQGFAQDSLHLTQNHTAHVVLAANRLGRLQAVVGATPGSSAELELRADNRLDATSLRVAERGKLVAHNVALPALRWQLGDSARVELSGRSLMKLR